MPTDIRWDHLTNTELVQLRHAVKDDDFPESKDIQYLRELDSYIKGRALETHSKKASKKMW